MSTAEDARRAKWEYEPHTPVCATCTGYRRAQVDTRGNKPVLQMARCVPGRFDVVSTGCCKKWRDRKTGETLA